MVIWSSIVPGLVGSGDSEVDESAKVECGGSGVEPGVGFDGASGAEAVVSAVDEPGDGVYARWSLTAVVGLPGQVVGRLSAGGGLKVVVGSGGQSPADLGIGAPLPRRGHPVHSFPNTALHWWCRPPRSDKGAVCSAGQVTFL